MANDLLTSILEGGIRSPNFFNGRLLSGEDLNMEKAANRDARRRLGRALGDGVAFGFDILENTQLSTIERPVVTITPGLAVNRMGQSLMLTTNTDVTLAPSVEREEPAARTFYHCTPTSPEVYIAGGGVYLIVVHPAVEKEGRAPMSSLGNGSASCNARNVVECLRFRLIKLPLTDEELGDVPHLRNVVAYKCFGVTDPGYTDYVSNPFGEHEPGYGMLDSMRPNTLTDCDVPLALIYWNTKDGIGFIDLWSVRRRITPPTSDSPWLTLTSPRRMSVGEAMFLQFQEQVADFIQQEDNPASLNALSCFGVLPPIGILPLDSGASGKGVNPVTFFKELTVRAAFSTVGDLVPAKKHAISDGIYIEGSQIGELVREAVLYPPIDLDSKELIWLYVVRENMHSIEEKLVPAARPYAIFVNGHVLYRGGARFDVNRWNYSNYA